MALNKILIFSGPSGGHLFPAQALAETMRENWPQARICLVTSIRARNLCSQFPEGIFGEIDYLPEFGSPAGFSFASLMIILRIPAAMLQSWQIISKLNPDICIGFGSFVSYFGVLFASWRSIPTLIHEQNKMPGKATRMLKNVVRKIALSFPDTDLDCRPEKVIATGLPIRKFLREGVTPIRQKGEGVFSLLICGGSQGSEFLNQLMMKTISLLTAEERARFAVIHITGLDGESEVRTSYNELGVKAEVHPFFANMRSLYNRVHGSISRAGANSAFEQAIYGIPTVFIPYPFADGHQIFNAQYFVERGGAVMHAQDDAAVVWLAGILREWLKRPESYWKMSEQMSKMALGDGHARLFDAVQNLAILN